MERESGSKTCHYTDTSGRAVTGDVHRPRLKSAGKSLRRKGTCARCQTISNIFINDTGKNSKFTAEKPKRPPQVIKIKTSSNEIGRRRHAPLTGGAAQEPALFLHVLAKNVRSLSNQETHLPNPDQGTRCEAADHCSSQMSQSGDHGVPVAGGDTTTECDVGIEEQKEDFSGHTGGM